MIDYKDFVSKAQSLLIAPAGFGKTHTIGECLKYTEGKQLILTHTHAGIASIKSKIKKAGIPPAKYHIETITSFAQKYVLAFYTLEDIPNQEDSKRYYPFIIDKAKDIIAKKQIQNIIQLSYNGLFVDEYQDCTIKQHALILELTKVLQCRILGDSLQGIFNFNSNPLVNLDCTTEFAAFLANKYELQTPWRWKIGGNERLGLDLKLLRKKLLSNELIDLIDYHSFETHIVDDIYQLNREIHKIIAESNSLLIIDPVTTHINTRKTFNQRFNNRCVMLESIDNIDFYLLAKLVDTINTENIFLKIRELSKKVLSITSFNNWFNATGLKRKRDADDKILVNDLQKLFNQFNKNQSSSIIADILKEIKSLPGMKCYRRELLNSLINSLIEADCKGITVEIAMKNTRNNVRQIGRRVTGKCIGTTLLTKGLEFETVIVLNAHLFQPKHLYVALTRASKRLIVITEKKVLNPYVNPAI